MAQHPFLKSIRPVNLLSFGPNTEEIELRPLNILIGPIGCGKSNLIEILGLLSKLPDKDPWAKVRETGGASEWVWKGKAAGERQSSLSVTGVSEVESPFSSSDRVAEKFVFYSISLRVRERYGSFEVVSECFREIDDGEDGISVTIGTFEREGKTGLIRAEIGAKDSPETFNNLNLDRSFLSNPDARAQISFYLSRIFEFEVGIEHFAFYRDWIFGTGLIARQPISAGQPVEGLQENTSNLAQILARYQSDFRPVFDRLNELMKKFYEPIKGVEVRIVSTHLQVAILEEGGFSIPAYRLSDGTLRWLALLAILLNPTPAPVTCIEEPELGLHPDMLPTLADLLVDASTRTQLIVTTHSDSLLDAFTETPEVVCVCEKVEGATVIRRLDAERLKIWRGEYSLGKLWASGEIGGNRW